MFKTTRHNSTPFFVQKLQNTTPSLYLCFLIRIGQQGYQHVNEKNHPQDKKSSVKQFSKDGRGGIHRYHEARTFRTIQQRPAQITENRPPAAREQEYDCSVSVQAPLFATVGWAIRNFITTHEVGICLPLLATLGHLTCGREFKQLGLI